MGPDCGRPCNLGNEISNFGPVVPQQMYGPLMGSDQYSGQQQVCFYLFLSEIELGLIFQNVSG